MNDRTVAGAAVGLDVPAHRVQPVMVNVAANKSAARYRSMTAGNAPALQTAVGSAMRDRVSMANAGFKVSPVLHEFHIDE
jgi:hypothetical protein